MTIFSALMVLVGVGVLFWSCVVLFGYVGEPRRGADRDRTSGTWCKSVDFMYPPGLEHRERSEFLNEEQDFIEAFWYPSAFTSRCTDAGIYKVRTADDDGTKVYEFPQVTGFSDSPTGVEVTISATGAVTPSDVAGAAERLMSDIVGDSHHVVEVARGAVRIRLESRDPLGGDFDATEVYGAPPATREVAAADFFAALNQEKETDHVDPR